MDKQKGIKTELDEPVEIGLDPVSGMEEIIPEMAEEDDPDYHALGDALSLEALSEQENEDDEDEELDD